MTDQPPLCAPSLCTHPPARLFTWFAHDGTLCIACCDCGEVLAGAAEPWRQVTEAEENQDMIAPKTSSSKPTPSTATFSVQPASKASARWPTPTTPTASATTRSLSAATTTSTSSPTASPRPSSCCRNSSPTNGP